MVEEKGGWYVVNVKDAKWNASEAFGDRCSLETKAPFPQTGVRLAVIGPGQPNCRYHRENAQEDFLVLSGQCRLLVNEEEHLLEAWDFVHCPPGVSHVFVGAGDGPCSLLMIGHRPADHELYYPASELARKHGAETTEPTADPRVAYRDVKRGETIDSPVWPRGE